MIDVRYATLEGGAREFDEIVATTDVECVHLEKMTDSTFSLIIETRRERAIFTIGAQRAPVTATENCRERVNRRSEGQRRRWNALTPAQRRRKRPR